MQTIIWTCMLGTMWDFTGDDLACLFLGFDDEPFLSAKKKPDILFLLPRENWVEYFWPTLLRQFFMRLSCYRQWIAS